MRLQLLYLLLLLPWRRSPAAAAAPHSCFGEKPTGLLDQQQLSLARPTNPLLLLLCLLLLKMLARFSCQIYEQQGAAEEAESTGLAPAAAAAVEKSQTQALPLTGLAAAASAVLALPAAGLVRTKTVRQQETAAEHGKLVEGAGEHAWHLRSLFLLQLSPQQGAAAAAAAATAGHATAAAAAPAAAAPYPSSKKKLA